MKRLIVIHNPAAGGSKRNRLERMVKALRDRGHAVAILPTAAAGDAGRMAARIAPGDADAIVVAGGDGTINEVANCVSAHSPPLAVLPLGTANVLALETGIGHDPALAVEAIDRGAVTPVYPGLVDGRRFLLMASAGLDSRAVERAHGRLKRYFGQAGFVLAALIEIALYRREPIRVEIDGDRIEADLVVVTRASRYAGSFTIAPKACLSEPGLWVVAPLRRGRLAMLRHGLALLRGRLADLDDVVVRRAETVVFLGPEGHPVQVDGDVTARAPVTVTASHEAIELLYPPV